MAATVGLATGSVRGDIILASNIPANYQIGDLELGVGYSGAGGYTNEAAAQEFTAQSGGVVSKLTTTVVQSFPQGVPLDVSIRAASGATPGGLLGSVLIDPNQVSRNLQQSLSTFDLSSANIGLVAGQHYFATFTVTTPLPPPAWQVVMMW